MVNEPIMAVPIEMVQQKIPGYIENQEIESNDNIPAFILTDINQAILEGDNELEKGEWYTHEEAMKHIYKLLES